MKNFVFLSLFWITTSSFLFSQEYKVSGVVKDSEDLVLAHANVFLLAIGDSTMIKGTSADNQGYFEIAGVSRGNYFVKASYIENESELLWVEVISDIDIDSIKVGSSAQSLEEVVVTLQKPRLERQVDRMVFSIANTALSDDDIWSVLKHTPSIVVVDNILTIKGTNSVGLLINDRIVNLPEEDIINLLSGTSASNVEAIEIITNPPAKYTAEGDMLINIKMKKNLIAGYNGAIYNRYVQGVFPKHTFGMDHFFKGKKTRASINYNYGNSKDLAKFTDVTHFFEADEIASVWTAEQEYTKRIKRHNATTFFDYDIDDKNTISLSTIHEWSPKVDRIYDSETFVNEPNGTFDSRFSTINDSHEEQLNTSYYLDYVHKWNKRGGEIAINSHYTYYDYERGQVLETDFFDVNGNMTGENDFTTNAEQNLNLFSLQADYSQPLGAFAKIESGVRYASIASKSIISQQGFDQSQVGVEPTLAGRFTYDESIYAAYTSFDMKWDLWNVKSGLRAEYTETLGHLDVRAEVNERTYLELFPSLSVKYTLNKIHEFSLQYYRRINRPRYGSVNPFQVFQSNNSVVEGNPDLLPAIRNYMALEYTFEGSYTAEIFYRNQKNQLRQQVFQDNETNLLRFISTNLDRDITYGTYLSLNKDITRFWYSYLSLSYYYKENRFTDIETQQVLENGLWAWYIRASNGFTLLNDKSLLLDIDFSYFSRLAVGNSRQDPHSKLGIALRKTLWNKKASISMGVEDIFNQGNLFNIRQFNNQYNTSLSRRENRLFTLGFRYKFGNVTIKNNKKSKSIDERDRI
ncbi:outer membrane beta-barrel family protein [uncultured Kriegella sp.]|uniref:outer membrane beta-barrel family protein n=1 Tax=uncultured Kriegella sp. TaxID=1798910 RepID=UPI0030DC0BCB